MAGKTVGGLPPQPCSKSQGAQRTRAPRHRGKRRPIGRGNRAPRGAGRFGAVCRTGRAVIEADHGMWTGSGSPRVTKHKYSTPYADVTRVTAASSARRFHMRPCIRGDANSSDSIWKHWRSRPPPLAPPVTLRSSPASHSRFAEASPAPSCGQCIRYGARAENHRSMHLRLHRRGVPKNPPVSH